MFKRNEVGIIDICEIILIVIGKLIRRLYLIIVDIKIMSK